MPFSVYLPVRMTTVLWVVWGVEGDLFFVGVVGGAPPPLWLWLGLGGMKRHDLRSSLLSCGCVWVWVSQMGEFVSLYGMGMREDIYMIKQDCL